MPYKITFYCKLFVTYITLIWLLPSVSSLMPHKITLSYKLFVTYITLVGMFLFVHLLMMHIVSHHNKLYVTNITLIWHSPGEAHIILICPVVYITNTDALLLLVVDRSHRAIKENMRLSCDCNFFFNLIHMVPDIMFSVLFWFDTVK